MDYGDNGELKLFSNLIHIIDAIKNGMHVANFAPTKYSVPNCEAVVCGNVILCTKISVD